MPGRYGEAGLGPQGDRAADAAFERRRASRAASRRAIDRGRGVQGQRARLCRSARRSSARAAAPAGSAWSISGSDGRSRRRTIWRKPKPLTAVRSNGCGRIASTAAAAACRLVARQGRKVDADRAARCRSADRPRRRRRAGLGERGRRQAAVDVEQGHRRRQAHPERAAGEGDLAGRRLLEQLGPARLLEPVGAVAASGADCRSARRGSARRGAAGRSRAPWRAWAGRAPGSPRGRSRRETRAPSVRPAAAARRSPRVPSSSVATPAMCGQPGRDDGAGAQARAARSRLRGSRRPRPGSRDSRRSLPRRATQPSG